MPDILEPKQHNTVTKGLVKSKPKYRVLADDLRRQIQQAELKPGDRLPSFAEIGAMHGVTLTTTKRVYGLLENEGLIQRQQGRGTFVAEQKRQLTGNIGIVGSPSFKNQQDAFYVQINHGVQSAANEHSQRLLLATNYDWDPKLFEMVDGLLLSGHSNETNQRILEKAPAHLGRVSMFTLTQGITSVVMDEYGAGKLAVQHLIENGHRRIACLMSDVIKRQVRRGRLAGFCDALQDSGIETDERWKRVAPLQDSGYQFNYLAWGREQMRAWLADDWRDMGCTALVVQNDNAAIGAMQVLNEAGMNVPDDVSIIGFDGTELCDHVIPKLTSIRLPLFEVGVKAMDLLIQQINDQRKEEQIIILPAKLQAEDSVAAV